MVPIKPNITFADLGTIGQERLVAFCESIKKLIINEALSCDCIIAAGNSGLFMANLTLMIYDVLKIARPPMLLMPFFRYLPGHRDDPAYLFKADAYQEDVKTFLSCHDLQGKNILFVDDEIGAGITALGIYGLLKNNVSDFKYYIVAEDQGFIVPKDKTDIVFRPYAKEIAGYNNLIFCFMPAELEDPIVAILGDDAVFPFHHRANLLLNIPLKSFNNGRPIFTRKWHEQVAKALPDFESLQKQFREYLTTEVEKILVESP